MPQKLKYLGVPVYMNGQNYYIPSLSTRDFREHYDAMVSPAAEDARPEANFDRYLPIIGLAIRRNYPDVTDAMLADWLDLHTFGLAVRAVQNASGLQPVPEGE